MDSRDQSRLKVLGVLMLALVWCICAQPILSQQPTRKAGGNQVEALLKAAEIEEQQGRFNEALGIYNRVIALSASLPNETALANFRIGRVYMIQRKFEDAARSFHRAVSINPQNAEAHNYLGEALGELKQYARAIEVFNRAVAIDPKLLKARYNMAVTYDRLGNRKYSEFVFRNLIKNSPDYALGYDGLAVTLSKSGRAKEAIPFHEKAIALSPKDPSYHYNLAISYLILGDTSKALEQQNILKALDPEIADRLASVIVKRKM